MTLATWSIRTIGCLSILLAVMGVLYNSAALFADFSKVEAEIEIPYFYPAFYTMSAICIVCYAVLLACGVQFLRLRHNLLLTFCLLLVFEAVYFFVGVGSMWHHPTFGRSVAAATGVANGGLTFQFFILFPLWAPFLMWWAVTRVNKAENEGIASR